MLTTSARGVGNRGAGEAADHPDHGSEHDRDDQQTVMLSRDQRGLRRRNTAPRISICSAWVRWTNVHSASIAAATVTTAWAAYRSRVKPGSEPRNRSTHSGDLNGGSCAAGERCGRLRGPAVIRGS